jgi:hypothetical protein
MRFSTRILLSLTLVLLLGMRCLASNRDVLILLDTSKSMNKDRLFETVKASFAELLKKMDKGDRLLLYTFDADVKAVEDFSLGGSSDIARAQGRIGGLKATGDWTYLTKAIDIAAKRIDDLHRADPSRQELLYILTDGKNEPPPTEGEKPITFEEILAWHKATLTRESTAVYLVTFGVNMPEADRSKLSEMGFQTESRARALPPDRPVLPPTLHIAPAEQTIAVERTSGMASIGPEFEIQRGFGTEGEITIQFKTAQAPAWAQPIGEWSATLKGDSTKVQTGIQLDFASFPPEGGSLTLVAEASGVRISPPSLKVNVTEKPPVALSWILPSTVCYSLKNGASTCTLPIRVTSRMAPKNQIRISIIAPEPTSSWRVDPAIMTLGENPAAYNFSLTGPSMSGEHEIKVRMEAPVGMRAEPAEQSTLLRPEFKPPWLMIGGLLIILAVAAWFLFLRPWFPENQVLEVVEASGTVVDSLGLRSNQSVFRRSITVSKHHSVEGIEDKGFKLRPDPGGAKIRPLNVSVRQRRTDPEGSMEEFVSACGQEFEAGGVVFRLSETD